MSADSPRRKDAVRPNIIFIITDQWRGDCLSASGHPVVETPNLDTLAAKGMNFTAAYSSCPSCIAARASMFTGQRPTTHGRIGYKDCVPWTYETTLTGEMSNAGYQTHCVGKTHFFPQRNHLGFHSLDSYEAAQNFDGRYVNDYWEWLRDKTNGRMDELVHGVDWNSWWGRPSHLPEELHNNSWVVTKGLDFLRRRDPTRPFFLNLSFHRPHPPIDPPQVFFDLYKDRPIPPPPVGDWAERHDVPIADMNQWQGRLKPEQIAQSRRAYYAQIAHIDSQIGRLMVNMNRMRLGPTWFIFTSDHGEMLGDHNLNRKSYAYEGSARVPFIVSPPQPVSNAHQSCAPVLLEDIMPTVLDISNAPIPQSVEGRSLMPMLESGESSDWREYLHGEHSACYDKSTAMQYLTDGKEKYVWFTATGEEQLFDLSIDPDETRDLAKDPASSDRLELWRDRMVRELAPREEDGLSDGNKLIAGKNLPHVRDWLLDK